MLYIICPYIIGTAEFTTASHRPSVEAHHPDIRPAQVFHGYPAYPPAATTASTNTGPAISPPLRDPGLAPLAHHPPTVTTSSNQPDEGEEAEEDINPSSDDLFGPIPPGKRRKFILVASSNRASRLRVKVSLDQVQMAEIPDSYRRAGSVYPRSYFPVQLRNPPGLVTPGKRFFKGDATMAGAVAGDDQDEDATVGRVIVPAPSLDGESEIAVPKMSRKRHRKDVLLNNLGYRMSWCQSRNFAGHMLFLQRSRMRPPPTFTFCTITPGNMLMKVI